MRLAGHRWIVACCAAFAVASVAVAGSLTTDLQVHVTVKLLTSSGVCGAVTTAPAGEAAVQVACQPRGGPLLPDAGQVPYQRAGTAQAPGVGVAKEPLALYSDGTKITSWRVVQLDNARYLELTIAW
jgi:hypothetical protein